VANRLNFNLRSQERVANGNVTQFSQHARERAPAGNGSCSMLNTLKILDA